MEGRPRLRPRNGRRRRERPAEIASRRQARTQGLHRLFLPHQNLDPRRLTQQLSPGQCFRYWLGGTPKARRNIAANPLGLSYPTSSVTSLIDAPAASSASASINRTSRRHNPSPLPVSLFHPRVNCPPPPPP